MLIKFLLILESLDELTRNNKVPKWGMSQDNFKMNKNIYLIVTFHKDHKNILRTQRNPGIHLHITDDRSISKTVKMKRNNL